MPRLTIVGDALLDRDIRGHAGRLAPDAPVPVLDGIESRPRAGGAGLAATLAARFADVTLICALGADPAGEELRALLEAAGVRVVDIGLDGATPEKIRVLAGDHPLVRLDRGGGERLRAVAACTRSRAPTPCWSRTTATASPRRRRSARRCGSSGCRSSGTRIRGARSRSPARP